MDHVPSPVGTELDGTVKWFKDEKGYGRILGDDDYLYFVHFAEIQADGYRSHAEGQRVRFRVSAHTADHGRATAGERPWSHETSRVPAYRGVSGTFLDATALAAPS